MSIEMEGKIFAVYKDAGPSSHDVIDRLRRITGIRKIGHAGTLDPMASGVLVVGVGRQATKRLAEFVGKEKEYLATVTLGATSTTDDSEGQIKPCRVAAPPEATQVSNTLQRFVGQIEQRPPRFSAIKVGGKCAYRLARANRSFDLPPRQVTVKAIELLRYCWPQLDLRVVTGPGVYIRSLARDIGEALGVGGYLAQLERTRVGRFTKDTALRLNELAGGNRL